MVGKELLHFGQVVGGLARREIARETAPFSSDFRADEPADERPCGGLALRYCPSVGSAKRRRSERRCACSLAKTRLCRAISYCRAQCSANRSTATSCRAGRQRRR